MNPRTHRRPERRPSPPVQHEPRSGYVPNVVDGWNVGAGVLKSALYPYRRYPEVQQELDGLTLRSDR